MNFELFVTCLVVLFILGWLYSNYKHKKYSVRTKLGDAIRESPVISFLIFWGVIMGFCGLMYLIFS